MSLGRGLRRSVDMFFSARDLVEENDCCLEAIAADEEVESTPESVPCYFLHHYLYVYIGRML